MQEGPRFNLNIKEWVMFGLYPCVKVVAVPIMQPLAKIGAEQQKRAVNAEGLFNFSETLRHIYQTRGLVGFYDATFASMTREAVKSSYKGPMQIFASDFANSVIASHQWGSSFFRGVVAGFLLGFLDPLFSGPIERYKTYMVSQDKHGNLILFFNQVHAEHYTKGFWGLSFGIIREFYKGLWITFAKQTVMNVAFFTSKNCADNFAQRYKKEYPSGTIAFTSLVPGVCAAFAGAPLDVLKTLVQHQTGQKKSVFNIWQTVLRTSGWKGLFAGMPAKFALITFGYTINGLFLNMFENIRKKPEKSPPLKHEAEPSVGLLTKLLEKLSFKNKDKGVELNESTSFLVHRKIADPNHAEVDLLFNTFDELKNFQNPRRPPP